MSQVFCGECGTGNPQEHKYCANCGQKLHKFDELKGTEAQQQMQNSSLACVYRQSDDLFLNNAELITQGYGYAYSKYPFKYMEQFRAYEREARETSRGFWRAQ